MDAKVAVNPDSDREGEEHDTDDGDVCEAVQQHHAVHQGALLQLEPDQHQHIDGDHGEIVGEEETSQKTKKVQKVWAKINKLLTN